MFGLKQQSPFLGADQTVFHHMRDAHAEIDADNPRCALERMRGTHAGFQLIRLGRVTFECQQARTQYLSLRVGFQREQFEQRGVTHLIWRHVRLRYTADNNSSSSSQRRLRPFHCRTPRVKRALACVPDAEAASSSRSSMA